MATLTRLGDRLRVTFDGAQIALFLWRLRMRRVEFNAAQQLLSNLGPPRGNSRATGRFN